MTHTENDGDFLSKAYAILDVSHNLYRYPGSTKKGLIEIAEETSFDVTVTEDLSNVSHDFEWKAEMFHYERDDTGKLSRKLNSASIQEVGNRVWINATTLKQGYSGGAKLYHIVSTYAYNNGKTFIGDPAGLSPIAHYRRLENMIVSAFRFQTTDHLKPHPKQIKGLNVGGWKLDRLKWEKGATAFNLSSMTELSYSYISKAAPDINEIAYDFEQGVFYDATNISTANGKGAPLITQTQWKEIAAKGRARTNGIGCNTLKRAVVTHSLLQEARRDSWDGVLGKLTELAGASGLAASTRQLWV